MRDTGENAAWAENQGTRKESNNYSDYCIKNLLGIFFKSSFFFFFNILSFLALFLKKNSFIPSKKKAQDVEFGFKRCNSDSQA